jgi:hypothetical protein
MDRRSSYKHHVGPADCSSLSRPGMPCEKSCVSFTGPGPYPGGSTRPPSSANRLGVPFKNSTLIYFILLYCILLHSIKLFTPPAFAKQVVREDPARSDESGSVTQPHKFIDIAAWERDRVLKAANQYLTESPITITATTSPRSAGGRHDFYSEADYSWPDPKNPDGPYVNRDGMSNPNNFVEHRRYLNRMSVQVPALVAAWKLTRDHRYAAHAMRHLRAWFVDGQTRMNPSLQYAQAIHGLVTGRGIGIIDTIHLVEVARAIEVLEGSDAIKSADTAEIKKWFASYLEWITTHPYGQQERDGKNNHGTCWVMQVAEFAHLTQNTELLRYCSDRFKTVLVPNQIDADGSFPQELRRTKPYGYSLFNLEAMTTVCQILSTPEDNLWKFKLADGRGLRLAMSYMFPYIKDKRRWPLKPDVMYDGEWPMRQTSLLFAGLAYGEPEYVALWKTLKADSTVEEVIRNFFIRQPVLWID